MIDRLRPRGRWAAAATAVVAVLVLGFAAPAGAHATLISTDPAEGAVLASAPDRILFSFNESVVGVPDGVQVFDAEGDSVTSAATVTGAELTVRLTEPVDDGTLVVAWRVVSEDGHPISGSLSFAVGAPSAQVTIPDAAGADVVDVPLALSLARWLGYVGLLLTVGLVVFTVLFLPGAHRADRARRRLVRTARAAAAAAASAWLVGLPLTALYQLGTGSDALTRATTWSALWPGELVVTAVVVVGVTGAVVLLGDGRAPVRRGTAALAAGVVSVTAPAFTGHARAATPEALAVVADMLHLVAGSVWLGGLVGLAISLPDLSGRGTAAADVLARFSGVAAGVLAALVATGSALAWRIVGSWSALVDTGYGRLLLVKVGVALVAVLIAAWNRYHLLPRVMRADGHADRTAGARLVSRSTAAEAAVLVVVLLLTGFLVNTSPGSGAPPAGTTGRDQTGVESADLGDVRVLATLSPRATGSTTVTVQLQDRTGEPAEGLEAPRVRLSSDQVDLGAVPVRSVAAGTYAARVVLPSPGTWRVQVSLRSGEFDNPVTTLDFVVGAD